ncbi:polyribonucleotide nucleotidyltransferase [candidate division CSSED10-310 bacterium]|uniref:Polyribonucleotide nucleotidyltransferase n=1 Tax=candidate division CSSED10-310 bacterium TaxID=2855610 RepID=A0ABV6YVK0_UNCC1
MVKKVSATWGNRELTIETGLMAKQAKGSVLITYGGSAVLTTAVNENEPREGVDFLPLLVDYREKTYAAGRIPGGFFKRESRPGDKETLTCRLIDRPLRPLFPKGYNLETQIVTLVISVDQENDPDILAMIGASTALLISDIPFTTYLTSVRVGYVEDQYVLNPTYQQLEKSSLDMIVAGTEEAVVMVECFASEVSENIIIDGIEFAHTAMAPIFQIQKELVESIGKTKIALPPQKEIDSAVVTKVESVVMPLIPTLYQATDKIDRQGKMKAIATTVKEAFLEADDQEISRQALDVMETIIKRETRSKICQENVRVDGRGAADIRAIDSKVGLLPMLHGSALFTRGETQCLATVTLGTSADNQRIDSLEGESKKSFMLHYNFPPFSVGEVRGLRGPGRREIGHGMLAERAMAPLVPHLPEFPYTLRIVSEILESNGSSSMATVCGSTLALMDAGVPIKNNAAGIAIGMIKEDEQVVILSDIMGSEDALGDMDLKVAGTRNGVTAIQMDSKISGISRDILEKALQQAQAGRIHILDEMEKVISVPRPELSPKAPRIIQLKINPDKIRDVIGPGGKIIKGIIEKTGAQINVSDDGSIEIASVNEEKAKLAEKMILELIEEAQIGKIYLGKVKRIEPYGAFIEILPGIDGLLHISQIADYHVQHIENELKEDDDILVKLIEIDKYGRLKLSRKAALKDSTHGEQAEPQEGAEKLDKGRSSGSQESPRRSPPPRRERPPSTDRRKGPPRSGDRKYNSQNRNVQGSHRRSQDRKGKERSDPDRNRSDKS